MQILGSGMSAKMWEVTVDHARTCTLGSQIHLYYANGQGKNGVVFNVVGQVLGIQSEKQYISVNNLSDEQKVEILLLLNSSFATITRINLLFFFVLWWLGRRTSPRQSCL